MKATESRAVQKVDQTQTGTLGERANRDRVYLPTCVVELSYLAEARHLPRDAEDAAGVQGAAGAVVAMWMAMTERVCHQRWIRMGAEC